MIAPLKLVIAGGKTGGHLFPGIAVAQAVLQTAPKTQTLFVGTNAPFEVNTLSAYGYAHKNISARPVKGGGLFNKAKGAFAVGISLVQALFILKKFKPDFVLGVGGFSSFAVLLAARILGIPRAIQEQNAFPGMTNRLAASFVQAIFTGFKETQGFSDHPKTQFSGNPVRIAGPGQPLPPRSHAKKGEPTQKVTTPKIGISDILPKAKETDFILLITGGSQGASSINNAVIQALPRLKTTQDLFIVHQTGIRDEAKVKAAYAAQGMEAEVRAFFQEMPQLQEISNLVICRSGAGTVSELCLKGLPSILIPYPYASDDHQTWNARALADQGGAIFIPDGELEGEDLAEQILQLKSAPDQREKMEKAARKMARPKAAHAIADFILDTASKRDH